MPTPATHLTFLDPRGKPAGWALTPLYRGGNRSSKRQCDSLSAPPIAAPDWEPRFQRGPLGSACLLWPPPQVLCFLADPLPGHPPPRLVVSLLQGDCQDCRNVPVQRRAPLAPGLTHQGTFWLLGDMSIAVLGALRAPRPVGVLTGSLLLHVALSPRQMHFLGQRVRRSTEGPRLRQIWGPGLEEAGAGVGGRPGLSRPCETGGQADLGPSPTPTCPLSPSSLGPTSREAREAANACLSLK